MQCEREHSVSCNMAGCHDEGKLELFVNNRIDDKNNILTFFPIIIC